MNGGLLESTYEDNEDVNFNTWNLDLNFSWEYAPGSFLSVVWQNELTYKNYIQFRDKLDCFIL